MSPNLPGACYVNDRCGHCDVCREAVPEHIDDEPTVEIPAPTLLWLRCCDSSSQGRL